MYCSSVNTTHSHSTLWDTICIMGQWKQRLKNQKKNTTKLHVLYGSVKNTWKTLHTKLDSHTSKTIIYVRKLFWVYLSTVSMQPCIARVTTNPLTTKAFDMAHRAVFSVCFLIWHTPSFLVWHTPFFLVQYTAPCCLGMSGWCLLRTSLFFLLSFSFGTSFGAVASNKRYSSKMSVWSTNFCSLHSEFCDTLLLTKRKQNKNYLWSSCS